MFFETLISTFQTAQCHNSEDYSIYHMSSPIYKMWIPTFRLTRLAQAMVVKRYKPQIWQWRSVIKYLFGLFSMLTVASNCWDWVHLLVTQLRMTLKRRFACIMSKIYSFCCCSVCKIYDIKKWNKTLSTELLSPLGVVSESSKLGFDRAVRRGMWFSMSLSMVWPSSSSSSPMHSRFGWDCANTRARCSLWKLKR
jgi:hypothetical protein